uniref:Uncharacterized protein n=1 Tax=Setaria digitata TaxID=48799 RepID=A0A915PV03_9BILA
MELEDDSSTVQSSTKRNHPGSRLSSINSVVSDKRHSLRGRRSSMSVKQVVDGVEITKDVIIGDDITKTVEKNSSLLSVKLAAIDEEKERLANYMKKLRYEEEQWDELLQNYEKSVDLARSELHKPIVLSPKRVEQMCIQYIGTRNIPSPIEIALAKKLSLQRKTESQMSQNENLKSQLMIAESKFRRLQELIKIQKKYLDYEDRNELLAQKAECDAIIRQTETWMAKHGFSHRLAAV